MKLETILRVYHEMDPPHSEKEALDKLAHLNAFLRDVKPSARLRAKDEGGVTFLHTRTGTFLGRFLKWLTVGWPEAMQQRDQARILIKSVLSEIACSSVEAKELKQKILDETLEVKKFSEFDIFTLRTQLKSLQYLVQKDGEEKPGSSPIPKSGKNQKSNSDEEGFHYGVGVATLNSTPANYGSVDNLPITDSDDEPEGESKPLALSEHKAEPSVDPMNNAGPTGDVTEVGLASDRCATEDQAKSSPPVAPDLTQALHDQSDATPSVQTPPSTLATTIEDAAISNQPAEADISAVDKKSSFGCYEITRQLSASGTHKIQTYQADAYILPDNADDLQFDLGATKYGSREAQKDGLQIVSGVHSYHDETRNFNKLLLARIRKAEDGPLKSLSAEAQAQHHQQLHERYTSALKQAVDKGAKTIVLKPFRVQLLTPPEIATLAKAIKEFQQTYAEVKIQVVFTSSKEVAEFNTQSGRTQ